MKLELKRKLNEFILRHLMEGHLPPLLKKILLFVLRMRYRKTFDELYVVKIMFGVIKGKKMILNLRPEKGAVNTEYLAGYRQESEEIDLLKKLVLKGQIIWDIGIYRGFYSLLFSDLTGPYGKVLAFDIDKKNCRVVNEVIRLNKIENIKTYNYGLSNENVENNFISSPSSNSRLITTFRGDYTDSPVLTEGEAFSKVQFRTLNSLVDELGPADLIKMDIDGAELFALDTADKVFQNKDLIFIIESHNYKTDAKITEFFIRNKCFVYSINEKRFLNNNDVFRGNAFACKKKEKLELLLQ